MFSEGKTGAELTRLLAMWVMVFKLDIEIRRFQEIDNLFGYTIGLVTYTFCVNIFNGFFIHKKSYF